MDIDDERVADDEKMDYDEPLGDASRVVGDGDEVMDEDERMDDDMEPDPIAGSPLPIDSPLPDPAPPAPITVLPIPESTHTMHSPPLLSQEPPLIHTEQFEVENEGVEADHPIDHGPADEEDIDQEDEEEADQPAEAPDMAASTSRSPRVQPSHDEYDEEDDYPYPTAASIPPITLHLPDAIRSLFTSHEKITWLKGKEGDLVEASLADVWAAIRAEMAREGLVKSGELVLTEKQMELKMGEDDLNLQTITFLELLQLHHGCGLAPPVRLYIAFEPSRFAQRFNAIQQEVSAQSKDTESVNGESEVPVTSIKEPSRLRQETPERSVAQDKEQDEKRHTRPVRAEYGGSRGAPDAHPNATWANSRPILPMNITGRRIIAEKHQEDDEEHQDEEEREEDDGVVENPPQRRDNDALDRDTGTDTQSETPRMPIVAADEVELKRAGVIDEHGDRVDEERDGLDEEPTFESVIPRDELAMMNPDDDPNTRDLTLAPPDLSPAVSGVSTPLATSELFKSDVPAELPLDTGLSRALENVPEETEYVDPEPELPVENDELQARVFAAEREVEEAQAEVEAAELAQQDATDDDEDEGFSEPVDVVKDLPPVQPNEPVIDSIDPVASKEIDEAIDLSYDVTGSKDTASPIGPLSPVASIDVGAEDEDSVYSSEGGVDDVADLNAEVPALSPPITPAETLDGEPTDVADDAVDPTYTETLDDESVEIANPPLSSTGKRDFEDYMREKKDAKVLAELEDEIDPAAKRSRSD